MNEALGNHTVDPVIVDYVTHVENRFGVRGLEDMIALATRLLEEARSALDELGHLDEE